MDGRLRDFEDGSRGVQPWEEQELEEAGGSEQRGLGFAVSRYGIEGVSTAEEMQSVGIGLRSGKRKGSEEAGGSVH